MKTVKIFILGFIVLLGTQNLSAQDMEAKKHDNTNWHVISFVKFFPGKKDVAIKLIDDYFAKADENAGINPPAFVMNMTTGDYDYVIAWKMEEGVESLNWEMSPDDVKWFGALGELTGGKAEAKLQEFYSYVESWNTEIGRNMMQ